MDYSSMSDDFILRITFGIVGMVLVVYFSCHWIKDIKFYRKNNWNYDLSSGSPDIYGGLRVM